MSDHEKGCITATSSMTHPAAPPVPPVNMRVEVNEHPEHTRPPLGVVPRYIWASVQQTERLNDLKAAMVRYLEAGATIPMEWLAEYNELIRKPK
jgi:hypothetical protein